MLLSSSYPGQHAEFSPEHLLRGLLSAPVNAFNEEYYSRAPHPRTAALTHLFPHRRLWTDFGRTFDSIAREPSVRAVVLASALPKGFSAGIDRT